MLARPRPRTVRTAGDPGRSHVLGGSTFCCTTENPTCMRTRPRGVSHGGQAMGNRASVNSGRRKINKAVRCGARLLHRDSGDASGELTCGEPLRRSGDGDRWCTLRPAQCQCRLCAVARGALRASRTLHSARFPAYEPLDPCVHSSKGAKALHHGRLPLGWAQPSLQNTTPPASSPTPPT